jgi:hypothetical protein
MPEVSQKTELPILKPSSAHARCPPDDAYGANTVGALNDMIAVPHAGDPDAAGGALQVEHEVGAVAALSIPHLERRATRGTVCWIMVLTALGLKRLAPPDPFAAALLAGFAPGAGRRFRCKGCGGRSFNALTGTPLARLRKKECWLDFGRSLSECETVVASAGRCSGQHRLSLAPPLSHLPGGQSDLASQAARLDQTCRSHSRQAQPPA